MAMGTLSTKNLSPCFEGNRMEKYRKLMKTNFKKEMELAFDLIDVNKTSYITVEELERICNQLNMDFTQ